MSNFKYYLNHGLTRTDSKEFTEVYTSLKEAKEEAKKDMVHGHRDLKIELVSDTEHFFFTVGNLPLITSNVVSESDPKKMYLVRKFEEHYECNCPHFVHRCIPGRDECKHIETVKNRETSVSLYLSVEEATYLRDVLNVLNDRDRHSNQMQWNIWNRLDDLEELPSSYNEIPKDRIYTAN